MEIFLVIFILTLTMLIYPFYRNDILYKFICISCGIYLLFISGLRDTSIGTDTMSYYIYFKRPLDWNEIAEYYHYFSLLFWYSMKLVNMMFEEFQFIIFITSGISMCLLIRYIHKYSSNLVLTYLIFSSCGFYAIGMSMLRQYLAISIIVYSIDFIFKKNFKKFLICMILSMSIHTSVILFLPAYYLAYIKVNFKNSCLYILLLIGSFFAAKYLIVFISEMFFAGGYSDIFDLDGSGRVTFIAYLGILLFAFWNKNRVLKKKESNIVFYNFLWIALIIQSTAFFFPLASRAAYIYSIFLINFVPEIIESFKNRYYRIIASWIVIVSSIFLYICKFYNINNIYPYKFFFDF